MPREPQIDLDQLTPSTHPHNPAPTADPVRDWITVKELCAIADVERPTACFWLNAIHLPRGDRRPWQPDAIPVDNSLGRSYRRIYAPDHGFLLGSDH